MFAAMLFVVTGSTFSCGYQRSQTAEKTASEKQVVELAEPETKEKTGAPETEEIKKVETPTSTGEIIKKEESKTALKFTGTVLAGSSSPLIDFNKSDYEAALRSNKLVVLYFYANWCPICKAEVPKLVSAFNELKSDAAVGFRVNYNDNETDADERNLAREFGVAYQHTKVFIKKGVRVLKSPETWEKDRYLAEINKLVQ